ncbi:MAG: hypothetical protein ACTH30_04900 [Leucobacter sp.]
MASSTQTSGRKRLLISGGALLAVAALSTAAFFADTANINLFGSADEDGIGGGNSFMIQTQNQKADGTGDGTWVRANTDGTAVDWVLPDGDTLTPGESSTVEIPLRNGSTKLTGDLKFKIGTVAGKTNGTELWDALRVSVDVKKGNGTWTSLVTNVKPSSLAAAQTFLDDLAAKDEATAKVTIGIDAGAGNAIQGQAAFPKFIVEAESK